MDGVAAVLDPLGFKNRLSRERFPALRQACWALRNVVCRQRARILLNSAVPNTIGQLSGVACVTGQGLTAETLVRIGAVDWMALHDVFRTDRDDFFATALD